ncbi:bL21 family ribosomal protein [Candidatus Vidania fulgoroideorum]
MIVVFKYKDKQYLINKGEYIKEKNFGKVGYIIVKEVIMIYSKGKIKVGKPFIKKSIMLQSEIISKRKQISVKFKRRKRYLIKKGFKVENYKIRLIGIIKNG